MMKLVTKSRTYQLGRLAQMERGRQDQLPMPRRLPAEVLYDTIYKVTGAKSAIPASPPARAPRGSRTPASSRRRLLRHDGQAAPRVRLQ